MYKHLNNATGSVMVPRFPDTRWELALEFRVKVFFFFLFLVLCKSLVSTANYSLNMIIK